MTDEVTKSILVVEDEEDLNELIVQNMRSAGFTVQSAYDGIQALQKAQSSLFDLVVLDILLPDIDGWEVCRRLRDFDATAAIPIVFLSALGSETDRIKGFDLGGDDYIIKPFSPRELVSRVRAILKRSEMTAKRQNVIQTGDLRVDVMRHLVYVRTNPVHLTSSEFRILHLLASNEGRVFSRDELLDVIGENGHILEMGNIDVHMHNLRNKIEDDPKKPKYIRTIWGVGYKFVSPRS
ncbi:response regulator transcription factor [bacterium]|nr:response regulator transcription factor [bacterium]